MLDHAFQIHSEGEGKYPPWSKMSQRNLTENLQFLVLAQTTTSHISSQFLPTQFLKKFTTSTSQSQKDQGKQGIKPNPLIIDYCSFFLPSPGLP